MNTVKNILAGRKELDQYILGLGKPAKAAPKPAAKNHCLLSDIMSMKDLHAAHNDPKLNAALNYPTKW